MTNIWEQKSHFYSLLQQSDPFYLAPARGPCTCIQLFLVLNGQCHHQDKSQPKCYTTRNIYSSPEGAEILQACLLLDRMVDALVAGKPAPTLACHATSSALLNFSSSASQPFPLSQLMSCHSQTKIAGLGLCSLHWCCQAVWVPAAIPFLSLTCRLVIAHRQQRLAKFSLYI